MPKGEQVSMTIKVADGGIEQLSPTRITYEDGSYREKTKDNFKRVMTMGSGYQMMNDGGQWLTPFPIIDMKWLELHKRDPLWVLEDAVVICFGYAPFEYGQGSSGQRKKNEEALQKVTHGPFVLQAALNAIHSHNIHNMPFTYRTFGSDYMGYSYKVEPGSFIRWFASLGIETPVINSSAPLSLLDDLTPRLKELIRLFREPELRKLTVPKLRQEYLCNPETLNLSKEQADEVSYYVDQVGAEFRRKAGKPPKARAKTK